MEVSFFVVINKDGFVKSTKTKPKLSANESACKMVLDIDENEMPNFVLRKANQEGEMLYSKAVMARLNGEGSEDYSSNEMGLF